MSMPYLQPVLIHFEPEVAYWQCTSPFDKSPLGVRIQQFPHAFGAAEASFNRVTLDPQLILDLKTTILEVSLSLYICRSMIISIHRWNFYRQVVGRFITGKI